LKDRQIGRVKNKTGGQLIEKSEEDCADRIHENYRAEKALKIIDRIAK
jgi:hypothetical protein